MENLTQYFEILELEPGTTQQEIKQAYRDLVNIWHPDRFEHNQRLKEKATEKLKIVNLAYDKLKDYQPPKSKPKEDTESRADTYAQNEGNNADESTKDNYSKETITNTFKLSSIIKYFICIFLAFLSLIAFLIFIDAFLNHKQINVIGWGYIISDVFGIYFYLKVRNKDSNKITAEDLAAQKMIRAKTHLQIMECMIIFATIDGQIEDVNCILIDLIITLGIGRTSANNILKKALNNVNSNKSNTKDILLNNANELSKLLDRKTKLHILSLFEMLIKSDGRVSNTEQELYGKFKRTIKIDSVFSKMANAMSSKCPNCNSVRIDFLGATEVDRWLGTKTVCEKTASGKYRNRTVRTTYVEYEMSYCCDECTFGWVSNSTREK